jgi:hypothetical protein
MACLKLHREARNTETPTEHQRISSCSHLPSPVSMGGCSPSYQRPSPTLLLQPPSLVFSEPLLPTLNSVLVSLYWPHPIIIKASSKVSQSIKNNKLQRMCFPDSHFWLISNFSTVTLYTSLFTKLTSLVFISTCRLIYIITKLSCCSLIRSKWMNPITIDLSSALTYWYSHLHSFNKYLLYVHCMWKYSGYKEYSCYPYEA